jgi:hypothetical protein
MSRSHPSPGYPHHHMHASLPALSSEIITNRFQTMMAWEQGPCLLTVPNKTITALGISVTVNKNLCIFSSGVPHHIGQLTLRDR